MSITIRKNVVGPRRGNVMRQNRRSLLAPSTWAASSSSFGMPWSAAM
jgi:hypothetical protein